ncbi:MAG: GlsB/YeaQ/YmgE family stress response membrane protein [Paracoccaceae bacterium]
MDIAVIIMIGAVAGFLSVRTLKGKADEFTAMAIGIVGALVGGVGLRMTLADMRMGAGIVGAVVGAVLLLWIYGRYIGRR